MRLLSIFLFALNISLSGNGFEYNIQDFSPLSGQLSNSTVSCMLQDKEGYLWIGTWDGLNRYDAYELVIFRHDEKDTTSIGDNIINALCEDHKGNIWIAHGAGISVYHKNRNQFKNLNLDLEIPVRSLAFDGGENLWIGTDHGVARLNIIHQELVHFPVSKDFPVRVNDISPNKNGDIFLATSHGLYLSTTDKIKFIGFKNNVLKTEGASNINSFVLKGDSLFLATYWGAYIFDVQKRRYFPLFEADGIDKRYVDIKINNENLWLLTGDNEIIKSSYPNLLKKDLIKCKSTAPARFLFFDHNGMMWISFTKNGLKYSPFSQPFINYRDSGSGVTNPQSFSVYSFYEYNDSLCWLGTSNGLVLYDFKNRNIANQYFNKVEIRSIKGSGNSEIWLGTLSNGLYRVHQSPKTGEVNVIQKFEPGKGLPTNVVFSLLIDSHDGIWVGSYESLYFKGKDDAEFEKISIRLADTTISKIQTWALFEDLKGNIWIGSQTDGLFKCDYLNNSYSRINKLNSNINAIKTIIQPDENTFVIGTEGGGLNFFNVNSGETTSFTESDGLINNSIWSVIKDSTEAYWMSTNKGISQFADGKFYNYSISDGLLCNEFNPNSGIILGDSLIYFGCTEGLVGFYPNQIKQRDFHPQCAFTEVLIDDHVTYPTLKNDSVYFLDLPAGEYNIQIKFTAFEFSSPEKVNYRYRMAGVDSTWKHTDSENRKAVYYDLTPGEYVFKLETSLNTDVWLAAEKRLMINISGKNQTSAILLYGIFGVAILLILYFILKKRSEKNEATTPPSINKYVLKATAIVENHLDDTHFSVEQLALEMGMSRSSLHKKLKNGIDKSASSFIRDIRLEKAYQMLEKDQVSVKEATFKCGFSDSSYFTKCFKQKFGKLPTQLN